MTEIRCKKCNRLLMKVEQIIGGEIKCSKCGYINKISSFVITTETGERLKPSEPEAALNDVKPPSGDERNFPDGNSNIRAGLIK